MVVGGLCYWFINHKLTTVTVNTPTVKDSTSNSNLNIATLTNSKVTVKCSPTTTITEPVKVIFQETTPTPSGAVSNVTNVTNVTNVSIESTPVALLKVPSTRITRGQRQKIIDKDPVELDDMVKNFIKLTKEELG